MCNFLSAIYLRTGKLLCQPEFTDSHDELLRANHIIERQTNAPVQQFVKLELTPPAEFTTDTSKWAKRVDQNEVPAWFDQAARFDAFEQMSDVIAAALVIGDRDLLLGGFWILSRNADVQLAKHCRIYSVSENAEIDYVSGNAEIDYVYGTAEIGSVYGNAKIGSVSGSAKIGNVSENAKIDYVYGTAEIDYVYGTAEIGSVYGNAKIDYVSGNAKIGHVCRTAKIDRVSENAEIGHVSGTAKIHRNN